MRSSGHAFAHWSQTIQVCAPVPGSVCSRSTPRNRGEVARRSAGYWNVKAGCGVYLSVTHMPLSRSTRKMVLKNLVMVFMAFAICDFCDFCDRGGLRPFSNKRRLG